MLDATQLPADAALDRAAEIVERGWAQYEYRKETDKGPCFCAVGALAEACGMDKPFLLGFGRRDVVRPLLKAINGDVSETHDSGVWCGPILEWNDEEDMSAEAVARGLRAAARIARGEADV